MDPSLGLQAASGLVSFLLKTTLEWLVCLLLARFAGSAKSRFNLWLTLLLAFVTQWTWMWGRIVRAAFPAHSPVIAAVTGVSGGPGRHIAVAAPMAGAVATAVVATLLVYAAMVAWRMLGALAARVRLARAMRRRRAPADWVATTFQEVVEQTALGGESGGALRECELWVLPGLSSPATLGWWRPRIIVPRACETQDEAELKAVFWHELKHVERRDALWNALVRTCRNLLWFHPAVHHAVASLHAQRELACDAAVVEEHPHSRDVYASCLVHFARMRELEPERAIGAIEMASGAGLLTQRVCSILNEEAEAGRFARAGRAVANLLLIGLMAATVPGLNILFAAEQRSSLEPFPSGNASAAVKRHATFAKIASGQAESDPSPASSAGVPSTAAAVPEADEELAAEHRAAMGVLTESSGMDAPEAEGEEHALAGARGAVGRETASKTSNPASWGTIAVDAAARMGPLMGDHDGDDRH